jgi:hypothetical protein
MAEKKNQHYVPQFYLREFSFENNRKQIGIFNIDTSVYAQQATIKFQASKKYYYGEDLVVENALSEIEMLVAPTIQEIIRTRKLPQRNTEAHFHLLTFVVLSFLRTTVHENSLNDGTDKIFKTIYNDHPDFKNEREDFYIQFSNASVIGITQMDKLIPMGIDLSFKLLINDSNNPFITSDNPVVKYNTLLEQKKIHGGIVGLGAIGLQVFLPVSPDLMIMFYDHDSYSIGSFGVPVFALKNESVVDDLNFLHFLNCERIIFFDDQANEEYIKRLHEKSKYFTRANQAIVTEHELRDRQGKTLPNNTILHSRTTECRTNLSLPFIKTLSKGRKYQQTNMGKLRSHPDRLVKAGILGPTVVAPWTL